MATSPAFCFFIFCDPFILLIFVGANNYSPQCLMPSHNTKTPPLLLFASAASLLAHPFGAVGKADVQNALRFVPKNEAKSLILLVIFIFAILLILLVFFKFMPSLQGRLANATKIFSLRSIFIPKTPRISAVFTAKTCLIFNHLGESNGYFR